MRASHRRALVAIVALFSALLVAPPLAAAPGDIGQEGPSWQGASSTPTASKPESKLWWNDGSWWGSLFDPGSADYHIFRLQAGTGAWVDTGTPLDERSNSRADTLWDGTHLYVASHVASTSPAMGYPSRLYRFSYDAGADTYALDAGFPVTINNYRTETLVLEKDSAGRLWATWAQGNRVWVAHSTVNDATWAAPFVPPVAGTDVASDDISSLVAFGGGSVGLMWSNQSASAMYFAVHRDGDPTTTWEASRTAIQGPKTADDHINLKSLQADGSGRVFAAVKTSLTSTSAPAIMLLARDQATGSWTSTTFGRVSEKHTRPLVLLDEQHGIVHMYATGPSTLGGGDSVVYEKTSPVDNLAFAQGLGTPVIWDDDEREIHDITSTKQNVNATTGIVVLASNQTTRRYWHHASGLGPPAAPTASFAASPTAGPAPLTVSFTDTSSGPPTSWAWDFGDGTTSDQPAPTHLYAAQGSYTVSLTVGNSGGSDTVEQQGLVVVGQGVVVAPVADAYVRSSSPTSNYGTATELRARTGSPVIRSYLRFTVAGAGEIVSARLRLRVTDAGANASTVHVVPGGWQEGTINWNNAPPVPTEVAGMLSPVATVGGWAEADITAAIGGNGTVDLAIAGGGTNLVAYGSRESADPPQLVITSLPSDDPPVASFSTNLTSGGAPLAVSFTDTSSGGPTSWDWDFGDGTGAQTASPAHTYPDPGTYTVSLTVTNGNGSDSVTLVDLISVTPTTTFGPVADAYVRSSSPTSNYGTGAQLRVRAGDPTVTSYLRFTVGGGSAASATLRLWVTEPSTDGGSVHLLPTPGTWTETGITWSTAPPVTGGPVAALGAAATAGAWVEADVSSVVTGPGTYDFVLVGAVSNAVDYGSRESGTPPQLVVGTA